MNTLRRLLIAMAISTTAMAAAAGPGETIFETTPDASAAGHAGGFQGGMIGAGLGGMAGASLGGSAGSYVGAFVGGEIGSAIGQQAYPEMIGVMKEHHRITGESLTPAGPKY